MSTKNQERYEKRNKQERGLVKVCIWIPEESRERVVAMAETLRKRARAAGTVGP